MSNSVYAERVGRSMVIVLNRPEKLNALTEAMAAAMVEMIEQARVDESIRCVVLRGEGRAFCAGDDLTRTIPPELGPPDVQTRMKTSYLRVVIELLNLRKPVVAILQGHVLGAGLDLALACDLRVAAADVRMGSPVVQWGLGGAGVYLLTQYLGIGRATELFLLGDQIPVARAAEWGLVTEVVEPQRLRAAADVYIHRFEQAATASIGLIKTARNRALGAEPGRGLEAQVIANLELGMLTDPAEGRSAWRERREPRFTGRYQQPSGTVAEQRVDGAGVTRDDRHIDHRGG